jgi:hypothetical protein
VLLRRFCDYNFREYALRRTKQNVLEPERQGRLKFCSFLVVFWLQFRKHSAEADPSKISAFYQEGVKDLAVCSKPLTARKQSELVCPPFAGSSTAGLDQPVVQSW